MSIAAGTRLGPYEIVSLVGSGGMGEVYQAHDTRLERSVAIKVLAPSAAADTELRSRFEREARIISSLDHPHICALHDIGQHGDTHFLVMQYLEGETLAQRLARAAAGKAQPLRMDEVLRYAIEIADALDKAHRQGIVHRDLKPGNIMLTKSGTKLLDFGLAKLRAPMMSLGVSGVTRLGSPDPPTAKGTILGTVQYMAPEQVQGHEADARSDVFAFGAVLYEMATGRRAFDGDNPASVIGAILNTVPPPLSTLQPLAPPILDHIVKRCLAKDPDGRWQSVADLKGELTWSGTIAPTTTASAKRPRVSVREAMAWSAAAVAVVLAFLVMSRRPAQNVERPVVRFELLPPAGMTLSTTSSGTTHLAVSPDGRHLAFVASGSDGKDHLWVRSLDTVKPAALPGTDDASFPFWSPDSRSIGFFAHNKLQRIELSGGSPTPLCDAESGRGGSWNRDGVIVFAPSARAGIAQVSANGGAVTTVTALDPAHHEYSHRWPHFLPDGRRFLFVGVTNANVVIDRALFVGSLDGTAPHLLTRDYSQAEYVDAGYIVSATGGRLTAQRLDLSSLQMVGDPITVVERIGYSPAFSHAAFSISRNGALAYAACCSDFTSELEWFDRRGRKLSVVAPGKGYAHPSLAPDEKHLAVSVPHQSGYNNVWIIDLVRDAATRFTFAINDSTPIWSPDGKQILFASSRRVLTELFTRPAGQGEVEQIFIDPHGFSIPEDWSPDGRVVAYSRYDAATGWDVWTVNVEGKREPAVHLHTPFNELDAKFSPNGRWLAYASDESGRYEVYVQAFPHGGEKFHVSTAGGVQPRWRRDGRELFYLTPDASLMAASVRTDGRQFEVEVPHVLFKTASPTQSRVINLISPRTGTSYVVTSDGQQFLLTRAATDKGTEPITIVQNAPTAFSR